MLFVIDDKSITETSKYFRPIGIQSIDYSEGESEEDAKDESSPGKLFYFPVVAENPNGEKVKYYKKLNRMEDQVEQDYRAVPEVLDKNSRRMSKKY